VDTIKQIIDKFSLITKKSLGQNFILDENITDKIVRLSNIKNKIIVEIGPGPGCLTRSLVKAGAKKIIAVEKDSKCIDIINYQKNIFLNKIVMIKGDFLKENIFKKILKEIDKNKKKVVVISNLPYKTAVPILVKILENRNFFQELILMFQKEVADRILAKKNTKSYGRISIFSQWLCKIEKKLNLTPNYFFPKPKVDSTILKFTFKKKIKEVKNEKLLIKLIKICFNQRRKTIKNNLKRINLFSNEFLIDCKINPNKRAEELDFTDFVKLSNYLNKKKFIKI
tara:strand:+ start:286 stop:1134 length:849 start_codon:yes stop_codon:yes gene_type:complete